MIRRLAITPTATMAIVVATGISTAIGASVVSPTHVDRTQLTSAASQVLGNGRQEATLRSGQGTLATGSHSQAPKATTSKTAPTKAAALWKPRPTQYPKTVTTTDLAIPMSDGTILKGDLIQPADASGKAIRARMPVIVTITAYNKSVQQYTGLAGGSGNYLVQRGYDQLTVDARGTGSSGGQWCSFCTREDQDAVAIMNWAHRQSWSNGNTAMAGPSYMGIDQIFAAAGHPAGLKAIFPQVPADDVYRDVVASGGQIDSGFMPLWLGLVTATGIIPPSTPSSSSISNYLSILTQHAQGVGSFTAPTLLGALLGGDPSYDSSFYHQRSPGSVISKVNVPTFIVGGEYDIFQRGEPMLFDNLNRRGVPSKIIIGPWNHLQASAGTGLSDAGYGPLGELQLRRFDHYVKGMADPTLNSSIANLTYYEIGSGKWLHENTYLGSDRRAARYNLSGSSTTGGADGRLTSGNAANGASTIYPIPVAGLCTRSTDQWTAGISTEIPIPNPCLTNNAWNDKSGVVFSTAPLTKAFHFQGPINAHLNVSSATGDGLLSVSIEDEAPNGTVSRITGGWQVISLRALDASKSRYLTGQLIQPYHPFTAASRKSLATGQIAPVDVEIFPTGAVIQPGHR
ncbi:MAG TPA: CocE/NonD family hydrolase, partial [Marmoricola sp.]|nr:CocE/NonD family hydrolase [Marmoricola sp.]